MRRLLPAPIISVLLTIGLLAFLLLVEARFELGELDVHSGRQRMTTKLFGVTVRQRTEKTDFSRLYESLGGKPLGAPHWLPVYERSYSLAGLPILTCVLYRRRPDLSFRLWPMELTANGRLFSGLRLTERAKLALLERCMQAYDLSGSDSGDKYSQRLDGYFAMHPSQDNPQAAALTADDFPTPEQALDESVWQRDWLPIVNSH